jgi:hypothetical protein
MYTAFPYNGFRLTLISAAVASVKLKSTALAEAVSVLEIKEQCHDNVAFSVALATDLRTGREHSLSTEADLFAGADSLPPRSFNSRGGFP